MTANLEDGGALVTAGLVANAIDAGKNNKQATAGTSAACANCGATLAGRYCTACGQAAHVHRSLWHIALEGLHGLLHFDTKSWRTIPLLIARPGLLTRRYIEGQRVRYVSPLAAFLFTVFLMFFVMSLVGSKTSTNNGSDAEREKARVGMVTALDQIKAKVAEQQVALQAAATDSDKQQIAEKLRQQKLAQDVAEKTLSAFESVVNGATTASSTNRPVQSWVDLKLDTGNAQLDDVIRRAQQNPDLFFYKLKNTASKFSFMLIPISLPFLWLMFFWRRGVNLYDHAVFSLYSLAFMSLLFTLVALMQNWTLTKSLADILLLYPPIHMFLQLRGTYSLGVGAALWRTAALLIVAGTVFVLFLLMIVAISIT
ncbi:MAG TPA: DUF3667 domain-containing protein [Steroidobacteraceae bacterium]|nr:DUF3667 domain-containing protein [Steroidobacteraceae bacterium]